MRRPDTNLAVQYGIVKFSKYFEELSNSLLETTVNGQNSVMLSHNL